VVKLPHPVNLGAHLLPDLTRSAVSFSPKSGANGDGWVAAERHHLLGPYGLDDTDRLRWPGGEECLRPR
jgi:hypothetical protein